MCLLCDLKVHPQPYYRRYAHQLIGEMRKKVSTETYDVESATHSKRLKEALPMNTTTIFFNGKLREI